MPVRPHQYTFWLRFAPVWIGWGLVLGLSFLAGVEWASNVAFFARWAGSPEFSTPALAGFALAPFPLELVGVAGLFRYASRRDPPALPYALLAAAVCCLADTFIWAWLRIPGT